MISNKYTFLSIILQTHHFFLSACFSDQCDDVPIAVLRSTRLIQPPPAFRKSASSSRLQNKLRKLLVSDSMEKVSDDETDTDKDSVARHEVDLCFYFFNEGFWNFFNATRTRNISDTTVCVLASTRGGIFKMTVCFRLDVLFIRCVFLFFLLQITPTDDLRKNTVRPSNLSSNSQDLSNSVSISCGVNSFFGKSLPDLTSVAVRPKGSRPIPYSTR